MSSENGWEPSHATPDLLEWVTVPGTNPTVSLQLLKGWPLAIMRAYAADYNAFIEPLRDGDSGGFTPTNSVATSNHLNGTAMDLDWEGHPFHVQGTFTAERMVTLREMLAFYEDTIFWAGDWNDPIDEMHHQMGYDTFNNPHTGDFIARKVRADGFSTFRRSGASGPPPVVAPPTLSRADGYAVKIIAEGQRLGITPRGIQIALSVALVETTLTMYANSNDPPSLDLPHDAVGSDHMSSGLFQQQPNWGSLADRMDPTRSATLFFMCDNGPGTRGLTKIRERINHEDGDLLDYNDTANSPGFYAQTVQGSAFPDRYDQRFGEAQDLYNRLAGSTPGDDMAQVPQDQWDRVYREITQLLPSRSPLRHLGEGSIDTLAGFVLNTDGSEHVEVVRLLAGYGHPPTLALLREVAAADPVQYPDRQSDRLIAQAILAEVTATPALTNGSAPVPAPQPQVVYLPAPIAPEPVAAVAAPALPAASTGAVIGQAYDALEALRLADALPIEGRAPLAALIAVLQTKNGSTMGSTA